MIIKTLSKYLTVCVATIPFVANAIIIGYKDWRQLTETTGFSYNELTDTSTGVCNAVDGTCYGSLGGVDFSGWSWATFEEVGELFNLLTGAHPADFTIDGGDVYTEAGSAWADYIIDSDGASGPDDESDPDRLEYKLRSRKESFQYIIYYCFYPSCRKACWCMLRF